MSDVGISLGQNNVDSVNSGMNNVLYHSKDQIITGPIAVTSLTADKFESNTTKLTEVGKLTCNGNFFFFLDQKSDAV